MPIADDLAALMRKRLLNSITLVTATHRKLEKAADGTSTQVATCMINKWMTRINGKKIYNIRGPPRIGLKKRRKTVEVLTTHKSFGN